MRVLPDSARDYGVAIAAFLSVPFVIICVPALLIYGPSLIDSGYERFRRLPFDSARWQNVSEVRSADPVRIRMVDDLLDRHVLVGRDRDSVVSLLGVPDDASHFRDSDLVYWLGPERGFVRMDSEWLVLRLDGDGRVATHEVLRD